MPSHPRILEGGLAAAHAAGGQAVRLGRGIISGLRVGYHDAEALHPLLGILAVLGLEY